MSAEKPPSREERLAQRLRENLHRRKAQARALSVSLSHGAETGESQGTPGVPKSPPAR
jgi:hypothetical protein